MDPDDYIPLCKAMGWPEWQPALFFIERLVRRSVVRNPEKAWWIERRTDAAKEWRSKYWVCPHVALCILERWAREKLYEAGYYIAPSDAAYELFTVDRDEWMESMEAQETEADAQIAALKTLCKETDDGEA